MIYSFAGVFNRQEQWVISVARTIAPHARWRGNREFDVTLVQGIALLALLSGAIVVANPVLSKDFLVAGPLMPG